jgi:DNA-binding NarL/FixJ family response regulator
MNNGRPASNGTSAGVLICDDYALIRTMLAAIVGRSPGLRVLGEAADGVEAIEQARLFKPDVILLDLAMPNHNGLDALPALRRVSPEARIIVFSAFAESVVAEQVIALGAVRYLEKGAEPATILATIHEVLQHAAPSAAAEGDPHRAERSRYKTRL